MLKHFKKLDLFGHELDFEYQSYNKYKTVAGALLSLLIIIITLVISLLFGREIFQRKNPKVTMSQVYDTSTIYGKDFYFALGGTLMQGKGFESQYTLDYVDIRLKIGNVTEFPPIVNCTEKHFGPYWHVRGVQELVNQDKTKCLDISDEAKGQFFQNKIRDFNDSTFYIFAMECNEERRGRPCMKDEKEAIGKIIFEFNFINSYTDSSNLTHPVQYYMETNIQSLNADYFKKDTISFTEDIYESGK